MAFYTIAFAEAFRPVFAWTSERFGIAISDPRVVSLPAVIALGVLVITKGANVGMRLLYVVVAVLFLSLVLFFAGTPEGADGISFETLIRTVQRPDGFFLVFAICFPAFTGMTAGVGLSGDLKNPSRSIPVGPLAATLVGMFVYIAIAYKLAISSSTDALAGDQLIMAKIAIWGPIVPIGLACATLSSALGSALVAPRTLQAMARDGIFPSRLVNDWLSAGRGPTREPAQGSLVVFAIAIVFVAAGNVNFVAQIISMFFMVTYGSLCLISFLEHFAADPSYRPVFRSRWHFSAFGAGACLWLMFRINTAYAIVAIAVMVLLYVGIGRSNIYVDKLINPSYTTAIASVAQLPGISGKENNLILFEFSRDDYSGLPEIIDNFWLVAASGFDVAILSSCDRSSGYRKEIHIWLTPQDYDNSTLMILLAYIILGHPDWRGGEIKLFALFPENDLEAERDRLLDMIVSGRLPISANNIEVLERKADTKTKDAVRERSRDADLIILDFLGEALTHQKEELFKGYDGVANILFLNTKKEIQIQREPDELPAPEEGVAEPDNVEAGEIVDEATPESP